MLPVLMSLVLMLNHSTSLKNSTEALLVHRKT